MAECSASELMESGKCFACLTKKQLQIVIAQLLCEINEGGGGGGGTIQVFEGRDPLPPDDPTKPALNFPVGGGTLTQWPANGPAWV